jgi:cobalt-zinc-cadmium efflux system protein
MGHHHDHSHGHHHHAPDNFTLAFALAVGLNFAFATIEAIYALTANSMSLLADAGHNFADVLGLLISWFALWMLSRKATDKYSYGFKRTTILAAFINAVVLVGVTVVIIYESLHKLVTPVDVNEKIIIVVAFIGIFINGGTALLFIKGQHDLNIKSAFLHLAYDALISFGVVLTGVIILYTHLIWLDALVGLAIAITILYGTWSLLRQSLDLILDAVPHTVDRQAVLDFLNEQAQVSEVHDLHIWGLSTKEAALTAHLVVNSTIDNSRMHTIHEQLASRFHITHATLQTETSDGDNCHRAKHCH